RTRLPWLAALDPKRFSVHLFADFSRQDALETTCRKFAAKLQVLPASTVDRVSVLRAAELDVLVFSGTLTGARELMLSLHRLAPLQIVTDECAWSTGVAEIDLRLTGTGARADEFAENVGVL